VQRVSVVIPTYNRIGTVRAAVDSALAQSLPPSEVIIVDDGSTDGTERLFSQASGSLIYKKVEHSGLPAVARNAGIKLATGDFVAFLDSDDRWEPDHLRTKVEVMRNYSDVGLACSGAVSSRSQAALFGGVPSGRKSLKELLAGNFVVLSSAVARRTVIQEAGAFDERKELRAYEDYELWIRLATKTSIYYDDRATVTYSEDSPDSVRRDCSDTLDARQLLRVLSCSLRASGASCGATKKTLKDAIIDAHERLLRLQAGTKAGQRLLSKTQIHLWRAVPSSLRSDFLVAAYA
jgi:teichuronic acid biosynthesis glycosyltransferase TuaG